MKRKLLPALLLGLCNAALQAAPGDPAYETCPASADIGDNVECYPVTFTSRTEVHPDGIPIIAYLFVPTGASAEPLPAIVMAHGSGSMYSSGNHNKGLNSKHQQWVRQYTSELGFVTLHVSSFHSRYMLADTEGDQRILDIDVIPSATPGGDDYRATSSAGGLDDVNDDLSAIPSFDPNADGWKDQSNGGAGISEVLERAYDMDAAWDFLAGRRLGRFIESSRNDDESNPTLGTPMTGIGTIAEIVNGGLIVDHERIFLYGTSHGGQAAIATSNSDRALDPDGPMNADLPDGTDPRRYAGFFNYYGGCGLYGVYGGADALNSTWRPYGPFLMLLGDHDDTVFDDANIPISSLSAFEAETCGKRIAAAKADGEFDGFLEAVVYKDAHHSFDGVEREDFVDETDTGKGGFTDWLAKIHANYRMTVPMMDAIGRIRAANRSGVADAEVPSLADFEFNTHHPYFDTVPLDPMLPPQVRPDAFDETAAIEIADLGSGSVSLADHVADPFEYYDMACTLEDAPTSVTLDSTSCQLSFSFTTAEIESDLPADFNIQVATSRGTLFVPVRLASTSGSSGTLMLSQPVQVLPGGSRLHSSDSEGFQADLRGMAWTSMRWPDAHFLRLNSHSQPTGYDNKLNTKLLNWVYLAGPEAMTNASGRSTASLNRNGVALHYTIGDGGEGIASLTLDASTFAVYDSFTFRSPAAISTDFLANFTPIGVLDGSVPDVPGGSGDDGSGDDGSGDDGSGDDGSGDDGSGDRDGGSGGGGGALAWLLPLLLIPKRRRYNP